MTEGKGKTYTLINQIILHSSNKALNLAKKNCCLFGIASCIIEIPPLIKFYQQKVKKILMCRFLFVAKFK